MSDLSRFGWHTGAPLRPVDGDDALPPLVRDVGPLALASFLRGTLQRLAGPMTPLLYLRTPSYTEPYVDHAGTGRLLFLDPHGLSPWFSGVDGVYVAAAAQQPRDPATLGYLPAGVDVPDDVALACELHDALPDLAGRAAHDLAALDDLNAACAAVEAISRPLRRLYQSGNERLRRLMPEAGVDERDLCSAFHHLETGRRLTLRARLTDLQARFADRQARCADQQVRCAGEPGKVTP